MGGYHQGEKLHMCPNCNLPVQWLGVENIIDPFWKRLHRFFIYPFSVRPLLLMLGLSIVAALLTRPGIVGVLAQIAVWGCAFKYAYAILQSTAGGNLTAPKLGGQTLYENFGPVVKQIGIYVAIFFAAGIIFAKLGTAVGILFIIMATVFLPAMIILLVTTESLIQAINPVMFVGLAIRIGWGYLLMYFFYSILAGAPALLGQYAIQHLPPIMHLFLITLVNIYYTFISYHLMGYVILQYHQDIGYTVDFEDFKDETTDSKRAMPSADDVHSRLLNRVNQLVKDGNHEGAISEIEAETNAQPITDPVLSERYYVLLKLTGAKQRLSIHGRNHLDLLVHADRRSNAMDVFKECVSRDPAFCPTAGSLFKLGGWLNASGNNKAAIGAFNKLIKAYPQDPLVPKSYFQAAQIFNDRLMNTERAKRILNGLIKKYPDHNIIPFVERYLDQIGGTPAHAAGG
jgi:tetratricopeptide (TPR) repeat protein